MFMYKGTTTCAMLVLVFCVLHEFLVWTCGSSKNILKLLYKYSSDAKSGRRGQQQPPPEHQGIASWGLSCPGSKCERPCASLVLNCYFVMDLIVIWLQYGDFVKK
ncbi:hypothetical protein P3L10_025973 [Capsicum annuum]